MVSDGASNMVGSKSGLITLLRENVNNETIKIHCLAHRLELSFRDVVKKSKLYDKLMTLLIGLHYFYKRQYENKSGVLYGGSWNQRSSSTKSDGNTLASTSFTGNQLPSEVLHGNRSSSCYS